MSFSFDLKVQGAPKMHTALTFILIEKDGKSDIYSPERFFKVCYVDVYSLIL